MKTNEGSHSQVRHYYHKRVRILKQKAFIITFHRLKPLRKYMLVLTVFNHFRGEEETGHVERYQ